MENILLDVLEIDVGELMWEVSFDHMYKALNLYIDVGEWKDDQEFQKYAAELSAYSLEKLRTWLLKCQCGWL